jgi:glutamyl-tRNA reductase
MELVCLGVSHHEAPVPVREAYAMDAARAGAAVERIGAHAEAVVVSTCNRTEFYLVAESLEAAHRAVAECAGPDAPGGALVVRTGLDAARHLFRVACGLDSLMVGETEVFGQVKDAYQLACARGRVGRTLHKLFQAAFRTGKAVRSGTAITRGAVSVGAAAVELAEHIFGDLKGHAVLVLGAGDTSEKTARAFVSRGVQDLVVANRTFEHGEALARELGGRAVPFEEWPAHFERAAVVVSSTAAPGYVVTAGDALPRIARRAGRELFLIDLAMPRDIDPVIGEEDDVYLYNVDDLQQVADRNVERRREAVEEAERVVGEHAAQFGRWLGSPGAGAAESYRVREA